MRINKLLISVISVLIIGTFAWIGVADAIKTKDALDFQKIQLKSKQTEIKELDVKYEQLNKNLDSASQEKDLNEEEVKKLQDEKVILEQQKQELEKQLQAKLEQKNKIAAASDKAINMATATQTASAQTPDLKSIVTAAAIKHGLDPEWFWSLAKCESTWNPNAVNYNYYDNGYPSGLYQHISGYWPARAAQYGYAGASVFDPVANANVTAAMWKNGSHLWECQ